MSFTEGRLALRRAVHQSFGRPILLTPSIGSPVEGLTARRHNPVAAFIDPGGGYAQQMEVADRLVFNSEQLAAKGVVLDRGCVVRFLDTDESFSLDTLSPADRPLDVVWNVAPA